MPKTPFSPEHERLRDKEWKRWGPYVAERSWGNVREDSPLDNEAWKNFPFDHARSRAYRWGEDGLAGFCDSEQRLCMSLALWNERCPILKERLFGLTNDEGNHGEDVKELFVLLDGLPSHAYMKALYKYPQVAYPYDALREQNAGRSRDLPEVELWDVLRDELAETRYFDVTIEYAKASPDDIYCLVTVVNRGPDEAPLHVLPHLWLRNTWAYDDETPKPLLGLDGEMVRVEADGDKVRYWAATCGGHAPRWLFTDNETNAALLFGEENESRYTKDGIGDAVVQGKLDRINPERRGTRSAAHFSAKVKPGDSFVVMTRLSDQPHAEPFADADALFEQRIREADEFYAAMQRVELTDDERRVQRQAFAGLCWSKTFYHLDVSAWHEEAEPNDKGNDEPPLNRLWPHVQAKDVISVPDTWEYPWFAAWDQIFQSITISLIDTEFAKEQVAVLLDSRYQHPDGQIPGFEGNFDMANPPVHAWGALHVYHMEQHAAKEPDVEFLKHIYQKLLLNYGWWFRKKADADKTAFEGGFLGMDSISAFDRSEAPPDGGTLVQADSYGWMGLLTLNMLEIALELAQHDQTMEDGALHFVNGLERLIGGLHGKPGDDPAALLWDDEDGFFYDVLCPPERNPIPLRIRSYVGLIPFIAITTLDCAEIEQLPKLKQRLEAFERDHGDHVRHVTMKGPDGEPVERLSLALLPPERIERILERLSNPDEFLSDYGLRSLSRVHARSPFVLETEDGPQVVSYEPGESQTNLVGGNSNWRGPIWAPINHLVIEALRLYQHHCGPTLSATVNGATMTPDAFADHLCRAMTGIFLRGKDGRRPVFGEAAYFHEDPHWGDAILFYEHFHGDKGHGLGASHQNGWTALIAKLLQDGGAV